MNAMGRCDSCQVLYSTHVMNLFIKESIFCSADIELPTLPTLSSLHCVFWLLMLSSLQCWCWASWCWALYAANVELTSRWCWAPYTADAELYTLLMLRFLSSLSLGTAELLTLSIMCWLHCGWWVPYSLLMLRFLSYLYFCTANLLTLSILTLWMLSSLDCWCWALYTADVAFLELPLLWVLLSSWHCR